MQITPGRTATLLLVFVLNPLVVGSVAGWLVGVSRTPVFAVAIPLVFGLLGVLGVGATAKVIGINTIGELIGGVIPLRRNVTTRSAEQVKTDTPNFDVTLLALLSISSLCFCASFLATGKSFFDRRTPQYLPVRTLFKDAQVLPEDSAQLYQIRFALLKAEYQADEYERIVGTSLVPLFRHDGSSQRRTDRQAPNLQLKETVKRLLGHSLPAPGIPVGVAPAPAEQPPPIPVE